MQALLAKLNVKELFLWDSNNRKCTDLKKLALRVRVLLKMHHDTQQSGIKQNFKQNVTNQHISGSVKHESGVPE